MKQNDLLWAINSVVEAGPCEYVGHWSSARALLAVVNLHKPFNVDTDKPLCPRCMEPGLSIKGNPILVMASYPCETIQAIEKGLQ